MHQTSPSALAARLISLANMLNDKKFDDWLWQDYASTTIYDIAIIENYITPASPQDSYEQIYRNLANILRDNAKVQVIREFILAAHERAITTNNKEVLYEFLNVKDNLQNNRAVLTFGHPKNDTYRLQQPFINIFATFAQHVQEQQNLPNILLSTRPSNLRQSMLSITPIIERSPEFAEYLQNNLEPLETAQSAFNNWKETIAQKRQATSQHREQLITERYIEDEPPYDIMFSDEEPPAPKITWLDRLAKYLPCCTKEENLRPIKRATERTPLFAGAEDVTFGSRVRTSQANRRSSFCSII